MKKNILILTGSPRKDSNSDALAEAFMQGARAKGHTTTMIRTATQKIGPCRACNMCWSSENACVFTDGFTSLEPLLERADTLVLATPLYWFTMSAQLKTVLDRIYAYDMPNRKRSLKISEAILLACGAGEDEAIFSGLLHTFEAILEYTQWKKWRNYHCYRSLRYGRYSEDQGSGAGPAAGYESVRKNCRQKNIQHLSADNWFSSVFLF